MGSVLKVIALGRLASDPETKMTPNGTEVCNFRLATDHYQGKGDTKKKHTEFTRITAWGELAANCSKYLTKGREVYLEGRLQTRSWEKDGQKHYATDVVAEKVVFLGGAPDREEGQSPPRREPTKPQGRSNEAAPPPPGDPDGFDDLAF